MSNDNVQPDWSKVELSDEYDWIDAVSAKGTPFKIGTQKLATEAPTKSRVADNELFGVQAKSSFEIKVNWPAQEPPSGFIDPHKPSAEETRVTSITSYFLQKGPVKYNELSFTCTEAYNFHFFDGTGDSYQCNVWWPRSSTNHNVSYFSSDPSIKKITGS